MGHWKSKQINEHGGYSFSKNQCLKHNIYFPNDPSSTNSLKNIWNLYWKCLATGNRLLSGRLHRSWYFRFFNSSLLSARLLNLFMVYRSSSHSRSAQDSCVYLFYIAIASHDIYFHYAAVPLTEFIKQNALSLATNLSITPL